MKNLIKNPKYYSFIIIAISLGIVAYVLKDFAKQETLFKQITSGALIGFLTTAIIGAWYRKAWVQYCFFAIAIYGLVASIFTLMLISVRMYYAYENISLAIMVFNAQYIFNLPFFALAYLARYFFDEKASLQANNFTQFLLASGLASCVLAVSNWGVVLLKTLLPSSFNEQMNIIIMHKLDAWQVAEKWWLLMMSLPHLLCKVLLAVLAVWIISKLTKIWSRQLVYIGSLFLSSSLLLAHGLQHLTAYVKGRQVSTLFGEYGFITDVFIIIVCFFIAGLLTTIKRQSARTD